MTIPATPLANPHLSVRLRPYSTNIFTTITALANQHQAINLSQGFPDFDGPDFIKHAAADALLTKSNQYAPMPGIMELRRALAQRFTNDSGLACSPDTDVTVTCGCTEALPAAVFGITNPGDEVLLFQPFFDIHRTSIILAGCTPVPITLHTPTEALDEPSALAGPNQFWFDPAALKAAITPRTRAIVINTPHNPTGKVFTRAELALIAELCVKHNLVAICDDVYERLLFDPALPHIHLATMPGMAERTITLSSLGKTFSLTGWKIGWAIACPALSACVRAAHQFLTFSIATPLQHAAAVAIAREAECLPPLVSLLKANCELLGQTLDNLGMKPYLPPSGYFIMADVRALCTKLNLANDVALVHWLIEHAGVATIPCSGFYADPALGKHMVRFAFCKKRETVIEGARRLTAKLG